MGECEEIEVTEFFDEFHGFGFCQKHERCVDFELIIHAVRQSFLERFHRVFTAIGIAAVVGFADTRDEIVDAAIVGIRGGECEEENIATRNKC